MTAAKYAHYTRLMLVGAAVLLIVTAALHATAVLQLDHLVPGPSVSGRVYFRSIWLLYAAHLVLVSAILIYAALRPNAVTGPLLVLCGLIPAVDALVMLAFVGAFPGNALLALASVLVFGAVARGTTPLTEDLSETSASREGP
jgi:hypothetical protein